MLTDATQAGEIVDILLETGNAPDGLTVTHPPHQRTDKTVLDGAQLP